MTSAFNSVNSNQLFWNFGTGKTDFHCKGFWLRYFKCISKAPSTKITSNNNSASHYFISTIFYNFSDEKKVKFILYIYKKAIYI